MTAPLQRIHEQTEGARRNIYDQRTFLASSPVESSPLHFVSLRPVWLSGLYISCMHSSRHLVHSPRVALVSIIPVRLRVRAQPQAGAAAGRQVLAASDACVAGNHYKV